MGVAIPVWRSVAYAVAWQAAWFATVLPAAHGLPWVGLLAAVPVVLLAGWDRWPRVLHVIAVSLAIGIAVDAVLGLSGAAAYPGGVHDGRLSPPWMWVLWIELGLALDLCLGWLRRAWWLAPVFGAVGGALSYRAGVALGAMEAPHGQLVLVLAVAAAYLVAFPLLVKLCSTTSPSPA